VGQHTELAVTDLFCLGILRPCMDFFSHSKSGMHVRFLSYPSRPFRSLCDYLTGLTTSGLYDHKTSPFSRIKTHSESILRTGYRLPA